MKSSARTRTHPLRLQPGLAVLRYTSADARQPSTIQVELNPAVSAMPEPGTDGLELRRLGQCVVLRIAEPTSIVLRNVPHAGLARDKVGITLEYLTQLAYSEVKSGRQNIASRADYRPSDDRQPDINLSIIGHVSRLGDRHVGSGEWLAGPERPLPIEGIAIQFADPNTTLRLRYHASDSYTAADTPVLLERSFSGTRGQARSIRHLILKIEGYGSEDYQISVDAMFLGSPVRRSIGTRLHLRSPSGKEPLVGLRLNIIHTTKDVSGENREASGFGSDVLVF